MSSAAVKKSPAPGALRRSEAGTPTTPTKTTTRPTASPASGTTARTRSIRTGTPVSARAAMQRSSVSGSSLSVNSTSSADDESRAETVSVIEELKERLKQAEITSEQFQKQTQVLQAKLDDLHHEQGKLEDRIHESEERIEGLENEKREMSRQKREMEAIYEAERSAMTKEREEMANREEDMQAVIQRLKDNLNQRSSDENRMSRQLNSPTLLDDGQFAPSAAVQRSDSRNNSKLLLQKDRVIEQLRLELAEAQIKVVETENAGGGRLQEVERQLMEARMTNARLMEDNESYQLLLQERTLNGDFKESLGYMGGSNADALDALEGRKPAASLADELSELADEDTSVDADRYRRLESELKASKDQNKALTLYINKIIERLLQHSEFEAILDQSTEYKPGADKDLPPPPPPKDAAPSMLERAKSVVGGRPKARPMSMVPEQSAFNDPETAPRIPIGVNRSASTRSRPMSVQFPPGVNIVSQMYKPPAGPTSPTLLGPQSRRQSWMAPSVSNNNPAAAARMPSGQSSTSMGSSGSFPGGAKSETSSISGDGDITTPPSQSPPRVTEKQTTFAGNKPRPLRLVQATDDEKKAKRASWMGWFGGKDEATTPTSTIPE